MPYIRFGSHRARQYGLQALDRRPQGFWSLRRRTGPGGVYLLTDAEVERMRAYSDHARFTVVRGPYDDLLECLPYDKVLLLGRQE